MLHEKIVTEWDTRDVLDSPKFFISAGLSVVHNNLSLERKHNI